jgi:hypothetical protein
MRVVGECVRARVQVGPGPSMAEFTITTPAAVELRREADGSLVRAVLPQPAPAIATVGLTGDALVSTVDAVLEAVQAAELRSAGPVAQHVTMAKLRQALMERLAA